MKTKIIAALALVFPCLPLLKNVGFRVSNSIGDPLFTPRVDYGSNRWTISGITLESLILDVDNSIMVNAQDGLTDGHAEILFQDRAVLAGEMTHVAAQIDALMKT